jgi:hypothetical protein
MLAAPLTAPPVLVNCRFAGLPDNVRLLAAGATVAALWGSPPSVGPTANGLYYLAITRSSNLPVDSGPNEIFTVNDFTAVIGPNRGVGPIADWDGGADSSGDSDLVNYDIMLTGTSTPEPATWSLIGLAAVCFALLRRKRRAMQSKKPLHSI